MTEPEPILLGDLHNKGELSIRALGICHALKLTTVKDLVDFYIVKGDNFRVRNCGKKTKEELFSIVKSNKNLLYENDEIKIDNIPISQIDPKLLEDNASFNHLIKIEFSRKSTRAQNCVLQFFNGKIPAIRQFYSLLTGSTNQFINQKNAGSKTKIELNDFLKSGIDILKMCLEKRLNPIDDAFIKLKSITGIDVTDINLLDRFGNRSFPLIEFCKSNMAELFRLSTAEILILDNLFEFGGYYAS